MKYYLRMLRVWLRSIRAPRRRNPNDVSRIPLRVNLRDIDVVGHMNNGTYPSIADLGRFDWLLRLGMQGKVMRLGWAFVAARISVNYRRSLELGERYVLETRLIGTDHRNLWFEQRFVSGGEVAAQLFVVLRGVGKHGSLTLDEVHEEFPQLREVPQQIPDWLREWSDSSRLPSSRREMPSEWLGSIHGNPPSP